MTKAPNLQSLEGRLDSPAYPTPYSDIVALLVFEHQMHVMNLFTRVGWDVRAAYQPKPSRGDLRDTANELVDYLLFVDEWPLDGRVEGNSGFTRKVLRARDRATARAVRCDSSIWNAA